MQGTRMVLLALILSTFGELGEHGGAWEQQGLGSLGLSSERVPHGRVSERRKAELGLAGWAEVRTKALGASWEPQNIGLFARESL